MTSNPSPTNIGRRNDFSTQSAVPVQTLLILSVLIINAACTSMPIAVATVPPSGGVEIVQRLMHSSGQTIRREWRQHQSDAVSYIRLEHIRAGQILVGRARLQRSSAGDWLVNSSSGEVVELKPQANLQDNEMLPIFVEAGQRWTVHVIQEQMPAEMKEATAEAEPALDLILERK